MLGSSRTRPHTVIVLPNLLFTVDIMSTSNDQNTQQTMTDQAKTAVIAAAERALFQSHGGGRQRWASVNAIKLSDSLHSCVRSALLTCADEVVSKLGVLEGSDLGSITCKRTDLIWDDASSAPSKIVWEFPAEVSTPRVFHTIYPNLIARWRLLYRVEAQSHRVQKRGVSRSLWTLLLPTDGSISSLISFQKARRARRLR